MRNELMTVVLCLIAAFGIGCADSGLRQLPAPPTSDDPPAAEDQLSNIEGEDNEGTTPSEDTLEGTVSEEEKSLRCNSSDEFENPDDLSCWTLYRVGFDGLKAEEAPGSFLDGILVSDGVLTLDFNTLCTGMEDQQGRCKNGVPFLGKRLAPGALDVELAAVAGLPSTEEQGIGIAVLTEDLNDVLTIQYVYRNRSGSSGHVLRVQAVVNGQGMDEAELPLSASEIYLRLTRSGPRWTLSYRTSEDEAPTSLIGMTRTASGDALGSDEAPLILGFYGYSNKNRTDAPLLDGYFMPSFDFLRFHVGGSEDSRENSIRTAMKVNADLN